MPDIRSNALVTDNRDLGHGAPIHPPLAICDWIVCVVLELVEVPLDKHRMDGHNTVTVPLRFLH